MMALNIPGTTVPNVRSETTLVVRMSCQIHHERLADDGLVYCTKNDRCNMILRHVDGECFSLTKLVIRAPPTGYTSPYAPTIPPASSGC
jgi:hypothetical protein